MIHYQKLWVGDQGGPPDQTYYWADTVNKAKNFVIYNEQTGIPITEISVSITDVSYERHADGGSVNDFVQWLGATNRQYNICYH